MLWFLLRISALMFSISLCVLTSKAEQEMQTIAGKNILIVIPSQNFRDEELWVPKEIFEKEGAKVTLASSYLEESLGLLNTRAKPEVLLKDAKVDDYDAVILVGGNGASRYWNSRTVHNLVKNAFEKGKVVGATSIAPVTLANAGILKGKKATVKSSQAGKLQEMGATYTGTGVEVDGKIITCYGPRSAKEFGDAIVKALIE